MDKIPFLRRIGNGSLTGCLNLIEENGIKSFTEIRDDWRKNIPALVHSVTHMDEDTKEIYAAQFKGTGSHEFSEYNGDISGKKRRRNRS